MISILDGLSATHRRKIGQLLRLCGCADLAEKFAGMEANATDQVIARLIALGEAFGTRERNFQDLAQAFDMHADSFRIVGGTTGRMAVLLDKNGRFNAEDGAAGALLGDLQTADTALAQTFESFETNFGHALIPVQGPATTSGPSLWHRLLRAIGAETDSNPTVAKTETSL